MKKKIYVYTIQNTVLSILFFKIPSLIGNAKCYEEEKKVMKTRDRDREREESSNKISSTSSRGLLASENRRPCHY